MEEILSVLELMPNEIALRSGFLVRPYVGTRKRLIVSGGNFFRTKQRRVKMLKHSSLVHIFIWYQTVICYALILVTNNRTKKRNEISPISSIWYPICTTIWAETDYESICISINIALLVWQRWTYRFFLYEQTKIPGQQHHSLVCRCTRKSSWIKECSDRHATTKGGGGIRGTFLVGLIYTL